MFVNVQEQGVDGRSPVFSPDLPLGTPNAVKDLLRQPVLALSQKLRIAKCAVYTLNRAGFALDVLRCPVVTRWVAHKDAHTVARLVFGFYVGLRAHGVVSRRLHRGN